jgi:hypothetical protein
MCAPLLAHAGSWFDFEAGIGVARSSDMGDGIWIQKGAPDNRERLTTPAYLAGLTGDIGSHLSWHADYVYFGTLRASVNGVPDANYNPVTHQVHDFTGRYSPFNGQGHTQGVALTLEPHIDYSGWRFGIEAGPWFYWATWHESLYDLANHWDNLSHKTHMQIGYTAGASVSYRSVSLSYRYYSASPSWTNGAPGLVTGTHMLVLEKKW